MLDPMTGQINQHAIRWVSEGIDMGIPFNPDNTDYRNFKKEINEETAELQDAEGATMSAAEAKEFVATLP